MVYLTKKEESFPCFPTDGVIVVTIELQISNLFKSFFRNVGPHMPIKSRHPRIKRIIWQKAIFQNINEKTVDLMMDKSVPNISPGFKGLSLKLMKTIKEALIRYITIIINQMLKSGLFPDKLKIAKIMYIHERWYDSYCCHRHI